MNSHPSPYPFVRWFVFLGGVTVLAFFGIAIVMGVAVGMRNTQEALTLLQEGPASFVVQAKDSLLQEKTLAHVGKTLACIEAVGGPTLSSVLSEASQRLPQEEIQQRLRELEGRFSAPSSERGVMRDCIEPLWRFEHGEIWEAASGR